MGAIEARLGHAAEARCLDAPGIGGGPQPLERAERAQGKDRADVGGAALFERTRGVGEEGLRQQEPGARSDRPDAQLGEQALELILDDVGQGADHQQTAGGGSRRRHLRHQRGKTGVFALGKRRFDAAARIIQHPHLRSKAT